MKDNPNSSKRMTLEDKYFFGAYLNMARHNAYLLAADINTRMGFEKLPPDDAAIISMAVFSKLKDAGTPPDVQQKIARELHRAFPFLKPMMFGIKKPKGATEEEMQRIEYSAQDYYTFFAAFFKTLNALRNEYTHAAEQVTDFPMDILAGLRTVFDASVRKAKTRFNFDPEDMKHLVRQGKEGKERKDFWYKFWDDKKNSFSIHGLVFFTAMLLERKYASEFTQKIAGLGDRRVRNFQATVEVFMIHCIRLPNARHSSDTTEGALLLDMLNELKKCPALLFEHLEPEQQERFRVKLKAGETEAEDGTGADDAGHILHKRYEDRFPYFALRFMDEAKWFEKLRFPVDLGNYHYKLYDATVDGVKRIRRLHEKIVAWGRLPYYEKGFFAGTVPQEWKELLLSPEDKDEHSKEPYIVRTVPHYHLDRDNIAVKLYAEGVEDAWPAPATFVDKAQKKKPEDKRPDLYLSRYELFGFVFCGLLGKERVNELEDALLKHVRDRKRLYRDIKNGKLQPLALPPDMAQPDDEGKKQEGYGQRKQALDRLLQPYGCTAEQIPGEIMNYLLGVVTESFEIKAEYRLGELLDETDDLLYLLGRNLEEKRKPGSKKDVEIKAGKLADFLAKDIMLFQPPVAGAKGEGKATSLLYAVMQSRLALYGANYQDIDRTFAECGLLDGDNPHPFLRKVVEKKCRTIVDFYKTYLEERLAYLEACAKKKDLHNYHWLKHNQARRKTNNEYGSQLACRMLDIPVVIPRGFFTEKIKEELIKTGSAQLQEHLSDRANITYMLQLYLQYERNDAAQDFYDWKRVYRIFSDCYTRKEKKNDPVIPHPMSETERREKFKEMKAWAAKHTTGEKESADYKKRFADFEWTEKQLRQVKVQDMITFLMCEYLMKYVNRNQVSGGTVMYLHDISPDAEKGILNMPTRVEHTVTYKKDGTDHQCTIAQEGIKVKNVGDFHRFARDRRLPVLLAYINQPQVTRQELEDELTDYDRSRVEIFKTIHDFEQRMIKGSAVANQLKFDSFMESWKDVGRADDETIKRVKNIRDKFSHNQYPDVALLFPELAGQKKLAGRLLAYLQQVLQPA